MPNKSIEKLGSPRSTIITRFNVDPTRKRLYQLDVSNASGFIFFGNHHVFSDFRIKQVVLEIFRKWFGHNPSKYWSVDGFMGQAWDKRGNEITIHQVNNWDNHAE
ncbi:MAG: hypothetical protein ABJ387_03665 [Balneola sp.]